MKKLMVSLMSALATAAAFAEFTWQSEVTVSGYAGTETLTNFPVLVRLSSARFPGFRPTLCKGDGADIRFLSPDGKTVYPHEIETWSESGDSLVWVRIPELSGTETKFLFQFGNDEITERPDGAPVWNRADAGSYAGVWHFNDTVTDGSENASDSAKRLPALNMDAVPGKGTNGSLAQMIPTAGPVGTGRINASADKSNGNRFTVPSYDALALGDTFTVSFWLKATGLPGKNGFFVSRKDASADANGWEVARPGGASFQALRQRGSSDVNTTMTRVFLDATTDLSTDWRHVVAVFNGTQAACYVNGGAKSATCATFAAATENGKPLVFGCDADGDGDSFCGMLDEMRLLDAVVSLDWAKAEYDTVTSDTFLSAAEAVKIGGGEVKMKVYAYMNGVGKVLLNGVEATQGANEIVESATVTYSAVADDGNRFVSWRGVLPEGVDPTAATVVMPASPTPSLTAYFVSTGATGTSVAWQGGSSQNWLDGANWDGGKVPSDGTAVTLTGAGEVLVDLTTARLGSLTVGSGTTLVLSNWTTRLSADAVTVLSGGRITCVGPFADEGPSNRVWIVAGVLDVKANGVIDADGKGYDSLNGPAWIGATKSTHYSTDPFNRFGGAYGGFQGYPAFDGESPDRGTPSAYVPPVPYGSEEWPFAPGSGAGATNRPGGGAVYLAVTGTATVNGRISANCGTGPSAYGNKGVNKGGHGSGGGIVICCTTISGAGTVTVNGGGTDGQNGSGGGSGGRLAVHYNATAQADVADCAVRFEARGAAGTYVNGGPETLAVSSLFVSGPGTIWFTDNRFLTDAAYRTAKMPLVGTWRSGVPLTSLAYDGSLTLERSLLRFDDPDFTMTVAGDLVITGRNDIAATYGLEFAGGTLHVCGNAGLVSGGIRFTGGHLQVDGDLTERRDRVKGESSTGRYSAEIRLQAAPTNAPGQYGVTATVGGKWTLGYQTYCFLGADPTNAAIPFVSARSMFVDDGARITAEGLGWQYRLGPGYSETLGTDKRGGAYGGQAGGQDSAVLYGNTYGDELLPLDPGSGGWKDPGSGVVRIDVARDLVVDGLITANSVDVGYSLHGSGGAAGSVFLRARRLTGTGKITANGSTGGKNGYAKGLGGGGRVAVYRGLSRSDLSTLAITAAAGSTTGGGASGAGTVYLGDQIEPGFLLLLK